MRVRLSAPKPGLSPPVTLSLTVPSRYSHLSLNNCLFVHVCPLCFLAFYIHAIFLSWFFAVRVAGCFVCCVSCMNSSLSFKPVLGGVDSVAHFITVDEQSE